jgi:hypothetical protein
MALDGFVVLHSAGVEFDEVADHVAGGLLGQLELDLVVEETLGEVGGQL